ncbi:hypothetical protein KUCAC02_004514, partial [Chaenocephalus aceratus]
PPARAQKWWRSVAAAFCSGVLQRLQRRSAAGHPSSLLTGPSMCLINQRHA